MPLHAVSSHVGAIRFGASCAPGELSVDLRMAREVDEHAGKPSGVEVHRDRVPIPDFLEGCVVGQDVEARKTEDLEPSVDPIQLRCRRSRNARRKKECKRDRRPGGKTGQDHDPYHLTNGQRQSRRAAWAAGRINIYQSGSKSRQRVRPLATSAADCNSAADCSVGKGDDMTKSVDVEAVRGWLAEEGEIAFLDIREAGQHGSGHPLVAVNLPYSRLEREISRLVPRRS